MAEETVKQDFAIEIQFEKNSKNPARIFETISGLIKDFEQLDKDLVRSIDAQIQPVLLLENVETGSVKVWLRNALEFIPDDVMKSGDYKRLIGHFLYKSKYLLIRWLDKKTNITNAEIEEVEYEILEAAKETGVNQMPIYYPMQRKQLVSNIANISKSLSGLSKNDDAKFITNEGEVNFNLELDITPEKLEDLITNEVIESESNVTLIIKKPDYLGDSMWEFRYDGRTIFVKILDIDWLRKFQNREISIMPKDALRCTCKVYVKYDDHNNVIGTHYEILQVLEIIRNRPGQQGEINFE